ncbi:hypothetical protein ABEB36_001791 [Hypothenemus hampei]|uniref:MADF domain-containing protein n=1 Tax=Hypothenemus hampei TaxID=57062 RepID=A0ABD1FFR6_HYPHA
MEENKKRKASPWNKTTLTTLLELLEQYPCLYDTKNKFYSNKHARANALNKIKEGLEHEGSFSIEDLKSKINNVRTQLSHEIKKKQLQRVVQVPKKKYEPVWWYDLAGFLHQHLKARKSKDNLSSVIDVTEESTSDSFSAESFSEMPNSSQGTRLTKIKKTNVNADVTYVETLETLKTLNENILHATISSNSNKDNVETEFSRFIAKELNDIKDPEILLEAKLDITTKIFKFKKMWLDKQKY